MTRPAPWTQPLVRPAPPAGPVQQPRHTATAEITPWRHKMRRSRAAHRGPLRHGTPLMCPGTRRVCRQRWLRGRASAWCSGVRCCMSCPTLRGSRRRWRGGWRPRGRRGLLALCATAWYAAPHVIETETVIETIVRDRCFAAYRSRAASRSYAYSHLHVFPLAKVCHGRQTRKHV